MLKIITFNIIVGVALFSALTYLFSHANPQAYAIIVG